MNFSYRGHNEVTPQRNQIWGGIRDRRLTRRMGGETACVILVFCHISSDTDFSTSVLIIFQPGMRSERPVTQCVNLSVDVDSQLFGISQ